MLIHYLSPAQLSQDIIWVYSYHDKYSSSQMPLLKQSPSHPLTAYVPHISPAAPNMQTDHFAHYNNITTRHSDSLVQLYILNYSKMH
jgi:hypothetical protein